MKVLRALLALLTARERRTLAFLFVGVLLMALLQVSSVALVLPFLSVAAEPSIVQENAHLHWAYDALGFPNVRTFLIALGFGAFLMLALTNSFILLMRWALEQYVWERNHTLSRRLLRSYLYRPYEYFLTRNSAELGKNILEEVREVTSNMLKPVLRGGAKAVVALFIICFLVYYDPVVALFVALVLGAAYGSIFLLVRNRLDGHGQNRVAANTKRYQYVEEAFRGIKDVKMRKKEDAFIEQYDAPSQQFAQSQARYRVIRVAPRYIIEAVAFGGIILIAVYLMIIQGSMQRVIPVLGLYAFAGYRLLPAMQQAFQGLASARFNLNSLNTIKEEINQHALDVSLVDWEQGGQEAGRLVPREKIALRNVCFTYPEASQPAVRDLSLVIPAQSVVGLVGQTGSGKTTTIDLVLGLLRPQEGHVEVDGNPLEGETLHRWQRSIGYVPQKIHLVDDTVARNIAFGVSHGAIDMQAVREAARRAQIASFVEQGLPKQWSTVVGEQGVKLSGGQRQRIAIARALYHRPSVLVLDEATSALDQSTEMQVMEAVYDQNPELTVLMVSHRLRTVRQADSIFMFEQGRRVGTGTYDELQDEHSNFSLTKL